MLRRRALAILALAAGAVLLLTAPVAADVTGPCTATMNGVDVNTIDTPGTALEVPYDAAVSIDVASSGRITSHSVELEPIGGLGFTADEGTDDGDGWSGTVNVADYATYGVGIYKVTGSASGPGACSGTAFVKVTGKSPLSTVAGGAGAGLAAVGAVGVAASAVAARRRALADGALLFSRAEGVSYEETDWDRLTRNPGAACSGGWLLAFVLTLGYVVSGAGGPGAPGVRPIRFRPRVAVGSVIWGSSFGIGTIVLAQQFAVLYPTLTIAVAWLVVMALLGGVVVPSLVRLASVRRINARLAELAASRQATASAVLAWAPTHRAPADGLDAWSAPDPASGEPTRLDPGLELRVEQTTGDWAQVMASNGWKGWVDARRLEVIA